MRNRPGPKRKSGERYPSGDLKRIIAPAIWGRIRDLCPDQRQSSELGRLWLHRELTDTQTAAGFFIGDIYRRSDSAEQANERTDAVTAAAPRDRPVAQGDRKALDDLLLEYPRKVREGAIELCVFNRTIEWELRPEIRKLLDRVAELWRDVVRQHAVSLSEFTSVPARSNQFEGAELRPDIDPHVEVIEKIFAAYDLDLDADGKARLIKHFLALRDREDFRQEKISDG